MNITTKTRITNCFFRIRTYNEHKCVFCSVDDNLKLCKASFFFLIMHNSLVPSSALKVDHLSCVFIVRGLRYINLGYNNIIEDRYQFVVADLGFLGGIIFLIAYLAYCSCFSKTCLVLYIQLLNSLYHLLLRVTSFSLILRQ
jgi:hypothetical protein